MEGNTCPNIVTYLNGGYGYVLSSILSFLEEKDGVRFLQTNKRWYRHVLPLFRIDSPHTASSLTPSQPRYRFVVSPVQDPYVLLQRLNTKRLAQRIIYYKRLNLQHPAYRYDLNTEELAWYEWRLQQQSSSSSSSSENIHPCTLELLHYDQPLATSNLPPSISNLIPTLLPGVTLLVSYPRSGNTLLRTLLERITNVVTGSDTRPDRSLSKALALEHNLVGEGITSPILTPIVKSHFPERQGHRRFYVQRVILLVRNPYDALDSYWNMCCTNTHTQTLHESIYDKYATKFQSLAHHEIQTWIRFHSFWMNQESKEDSCLPMLVVRYEDLVVDPLSTMTHILSFLLTKNETSSTLHPFWLKRLYYGLGGMQDTTSLGSYTPRMTWSQSTHTTKETNPWIGKALQKNRYSQDTLQYMHHVSSTLERTVLQSLAQDSELVHNDDDSIPPQSWLQLFGYDMDRHNFPHNFHRGASYGSFPRKMSAHHHGINNNGLIINKSSQGLRSIMDEFGRAMTDWRKGETVNDTQPFPTINRNG